MHGGNGLLAGRTVLVTGAARRVGACIAEHLHAAGANVMLHYRSAAAQADALAERLCGVRADSAAAVAADLLDVAAIPSVVEATLERFGRLDGVVNNASSFFATPLGRIDAAAWDDLIGTNLKAPLFLAQAAAPALRASRGAMVNIVDIHAEQPLPGYPLYCAAKAGLAGLTRALAVELAPEVRVNGVSPGPILWPEDPSFDEGVRNRILHTTPLRRRGDPEDIARAVCFLMGDAPYVTGQILAVDGGRSIFLQSW